jgi:hypothetical protein
LRYVADASQPLETQRPNTRIGSYRSVAALALASCPEYGLAVMDAARRRRSPVSLSARSKDQGSIMERRAS